MSFLDELSRAAQSPAAVWHQFVVVHDPKQDDWYLFLEGKLDVPFYVAAMRSSACLDSRSKIWEFRCGGKDGVLAAMQQVRRSHPECTRCLFFVDKDLQEFLGEEVAAPADLFCTEGYSLENYLVNEDAFDVVWGQLWSLRTTDPRRALVAAQLKQCLARFYAAMIPMMAWIVCAKKAGFRPNLANLKLGALVALDDGSPKFSRGPMAALRKATSCAHRPRLRDWLAEARLLRRVPPKRVVRGKFELWFFCRFMDCVFKTLSGAAGEKPSGAIQLTPESVARALIGKIAVPSDVQMFVSRAIARAKEVHCQAG